MTDEELWEAYWQNRTVENRNALVEHHFSLAIHRAKWWRYRVGVYGFDAFLSWASVGLIEAVERYKPGSDAAFSTFAFLVITRALRQGMRDAEGGPNQRAFNWGCKGGDATLLSESPQSPQKTVEDRDEIEYLMQDLDDRERECIWLRFAAGCKNHEVGAAIDRSGSGAKKIIYRARKKMEARAFPSPSPKPGNIVRPAAARPRACRVVGPRASGIVRVCH